MPRPCYPCAYSTLHRAAWRSELTSKRGGHLDLIRPSIRRSFFHARLLASPLRARYHLRLMNAVTSLSSALGRGAPHAASLLLPLAYEELRKLAAQRMAQEQPVQTLQPTALVS